MKKLISVGFSIALTLPAPASALSTIDLGKSLISEAKNLIQQQQPAFKTQEDSPQNFYEAKKWLAKVTIQHHPYAFYTNCKLTSSRGSIKVDMDSCGYKVRDDYKRASRGEAEHIVPASWIYRGMACSKGKSSREARSYCKRTSKEFNAAEGDLVNLQYAVGEVNADRAHYKYAQLSSGYEYGQDGRIFFDETGRRFMPPKEVWGHIGRVSLYMADKYPVTYSRSYERLMRSWAKLPPTKWECKYNTLLEQSHGYSNPYTKRVCF